MYGKAYINFEKNHRNGYVQIGKLIVLNLQSTNIFSISYLVDEIAYRNEGKFVRCVFIKVFRMAQYRCGDN